MTVDPVGTVSEITPNPPGSPACIRVGFHTKRSKWVLLDDCVG
jgi:hypothetical protein